MTVYRIADGHNNAAGLADVTPQPASTGLLYPRRVVALDGTVYDDGAPYVVWRYTDAIPPDVYSSLLTQLGLASAIYNLVTVRTVSNAARTTWANYNATIVRPSDPKFRMGKDRDVEFLIKMLVAL
jgi:hypothetical protein